MMERRRDPYYEGRRSERPFVNFTLPNVNFVLRNLRRNWRND